MDGPANNGALCIKGQYAYDFVGHRDRLSTPFVRDERGQLRPASWDEALDRAASGLAKVVEEHGRHSVLHGGVGQGSERSRVHDAEVREGRAGHQLHRQL